MLSFEYFSELRPYLRHETFVQLLQENSSYRQIFTEASVLLARGRWYDLVHTIIAVAHMSEILEGERAQGILRDVTEELYQEYQAVLIPAIMLHDIGWSAIGENKNTEWDDRELRTRHMEVGAQIAQRILQAVAYPPALIQSIVHLVAHHDDQYLGTNPETPTEMLHRDADACFILTSISFWKDFAVKGGDLPPAEFLEMKVKKWGTRYTRTAQIITNREIEARKSEIDGADLSPTALYDNFKRMVESFNKHLLE